MILPRWAAALLVLVLAATGNPAPAQAQATRADSAAILLDAAHRFERAGRSVAADAVFELILERFGDTAAAAEARRFLAQAPGDRSTRSGRVELQVWTTLYGLWLGIAVPAALGAEGPEPYGVGLLLGGPTGFITGLGLARSRELSDGQARAITLGGTWGTWQGFGWAKVFDWGTREVCDPAGFCYREGDTFEETFAAMIAGGLAGIVTGVILSSRPIPSGVATTVNFGALWGTWFGVATSIIAGLEGDDVLTGTLIGGDVGLGAAALLAPGWDISRNRARLISIAGVIGGLAGAGIDLIVQPDDEKVTFGIPLATSIAGLVIGTLTTRNYDRRGVPDGGEDAGALLQWRDGGLSPGTPLPWMTLVRTAGGQREPAMGITLLKATF